MRFSRDKRGYENTYIVHGERRRGKTRSRVLYWFRTPPGVKVGRSALDEDAIRLIEEFNPGVGFDWTRILKGQGAPQETRVEAPQKRPQRARGGAPPAPPPAPSVLPETAPEVEEAADVVVEQPVEESPLSAQVRVDDEPPTPAHARLGSEAVSRLRARHAEILARISERIDDPVRRDELTSQADRLNPDTWVTSDEVSAALEQYESVFASLRAVVGHGRQRRRRRKAARPQPQPQTSLAQAVEHVSEVAGPNGDAAGGSGSEES